MEDVGEIFYEFPATDNLIVVEFAQEPAPADATLRIQKGETGSDGGDGEGVDLMVEGFVIEVSDEAGVVVGVEEVLVIDACSHELEDLLGLVFLEEALHLLEDEGEVGLDFECSNVLGLGGELVGMGAQVVEEPLEVEDLLDAEVHQLRLHDCLHSLEQLVYPASTLAYLVWVRRDR